MTLKEKEPGLDKHTTCIMRLEIKGQDFDIRGLRPASRFPISVSMKLKINIIFFSFPTIAINIQQLFQTTRTTRTRENEEKEGTHLC